MTSLLKHIDELSVYVGKEKLNILGINETRRDPKFAPYIVLLTTTHGFPTSIRLFTFLNQSLSL